MAAVTCVALGLLVPAASAAIYPPGEGTFSGGAQGWQVQDEKCELLKIEILPLCGTDAGYVPDAGNPSGSLGLKASVPINLLGGFTAGATFESPQFTPTESGAMEFSLDRQFDPEGLLNIGPTASYEAILVDKTGGGGTVLKGETLGEGATEFTRQTSVANVQAGHTYLIRIEASMTSQVAINLAGDSSIRFDNVALRSVAPGDNPGGNGGGGGGGGVPGAGGQGGAGGNVSSTLTDRRLLTLLRSSGAAGNAVRKGNRVMIRVKCPAQVGRSCRIVAQVMLNRRRAATNKRAVRVGKGKVRRITLRVRPKLRNRVAQRRSVLVRQTVKAGKAKATFTQRRALAHR